MDLSFVKGLEFYAFEILAVWLVYVQFVRPWLERRREASAAAKSARTADDPGDPGRQP